MYSIEGIVMAIDYMIMGYLRSPKRTYCLKPMRYLSVSIENVYCHLPKPPIAQSIGNI